MGWVNIWLEVDDVAGEKGWSEKRVNPSLVTSAFNEMVDRKSTRLNSSHSGESRMPSSA